MRAKEYAPIFNKLVHKICEDIEFLLKVHEHVPDDFTQRLVQIVKTVNDEGLVKVLFTHYQVEILRRSKWVSLDQTTCFTAQTTMLL